MTNTIDGWFRDYGTSEGARKRSQGGSAKSPSEGTRGNYHPAPKPAAKPSPTPERRLTSPFGGPGSKSPYQGMNQHHYKKAKEAEAAGHKPNSQGWLKHILGDAALEDCGDSADCRDTKDYGTSEGAAKGSGASGSGYASPPPRYSSSPVNKSGPSRPSYRSPMSAAQSVTSRRRILQSRDSGTSEGARKAAASRRQGSHERSVRTGGNYGTDIKAGSNVAVPRITEREAYRGYDKGVTLGGLKMRVNSVDAFFRDNTVDYGTSEGARKAAQTRGHGGGGGGEKNDKHHVVLYSSVAPKKEGGGEDYIHTGRRPHERGSYLRSKEAATGEANRLNKSNKNYNARVVHLSEAHNAVKAGSNTHRQIQHLQKKHGYGEKESVASLNRRINEPY